MLSDSDRKQLHDFTLAARRLLTQEARDVLEGSFGLSADRPPAPLDRLPHLAGNGDAHRLHGDLLAWLADEGRAGLSRPAALDKLAREIAFTHLNRLAAFKMMAARDLIPPAVDRGPDSSGFKFWLVDHPDELAEFERRGPDALYPRFLLWQSAQAARELAVLFDPDDVAGRVFPRPPALAALLRALNDPALANCWAAEETIGWLYQYFNEREKAAVFDRLYKQKQKMQREDVPAATQLFTPNWIVRFLVQNTLGRLWLNMHPDTRLRGGPLLDYLVPQPDAPPEPLRPVAHIALLDPACGTMHFGLAAFDLLLAMYAEEIDRAGEAGWPAAPSVGDVADAPAAILADNLHGIDIDRRAVQLAALALFLRAKRANPRVALRRVNLACADLLPPDGARLADFLAEMRFSPLTARLISQMGAQLGQAADAGSLLRPEAALGQALAAAQRAYAAAPLLARADAGYGADPTEGEAFWDVLAAQVTQAVDVFAQTHGDEMRFFAGETRQGVQLLALLGRRYDVVVTNPPYGGSSNLNDRLSGFLKNHYPDSKGDLYTAFIERCAELTAPGGRMGLLTLHSFMFLSSYEKLRGKLLSDFTVEVINHLGTRTFMDLSNPNAQGFVAFCLRHAPPDGQPDTVALRLANAPAGDGKRDALEQALRDGSATYRLPQSKFDAIPGRPWAYWISDKLAAIFIATQSMGEVYPVKRGITTGDNARFYRFWWEVSNSSTEGRRTTRPWVPVMKGGAYKRWYGNQENVVRWGKDGSELLAFPNSAVRSLNLQFREGITWSTMTSLNISARYMPSGFVFSDKGDSLLADEPFELLGILNSTLMAFSTRLIAGTIDLTCGTIAKLPLPNTSTASLKNLVHDCIRISILDSTEDETTYDFLAPLPWAGGAALAEQRQARLAALERAIDDEVYALYGLGAAERAEIEAEGARGQGPGAREEEGARGQGLGAREEEEGAAPPGPPSTLEPGTWNLEPSPSPLAARWLSYAVGIVLGRLAPGAAGALGRAVYRPDDFAVGSLPAPDAAAFDALVGPAGRFAYVDAAGGRHCFPAAVEAALRALALADGLAVFDPGHPRDLASLVQRALDLLLGEAAATAVVAALGGDLRRYLGRDFFAQHLKWYRQRPVYWPLQTADRSYGCLVFHERVGRDFLYVLLSDYVAPKQRALAAAARDEAAPDDDAAAPSAAARRAAARRRQEAIDQRQALDAFAATLKRLADGGYRPADDWIDDGILLRLAPLHELIPQWSAEPRAAWQRLQRGELAWSAVGKLGIRN